MKEYIIFPKFLLYLFIYIFIISYISCYDDKFVTINDNIALDDTYIITDGKYDISYYNSTKMRICTISNKKYLCIYDDDNKEYIKGFFINNQPFNHYNDKKIIKSKYGNIQQYNNHKEKYSKSRYINKHVKYNDKNVKSRYETRY